LKSISKPHPRPDRIGRIRDKLKSFFTFLTTDPVFKTLALVSLLIFAVIGSVIFAVILRFASPGKLINVSAFQLLGPDKEMSSTSGKAVADLLVDDLHNILEQADQFSGNAFSSKMSYKPLPDLPRIPVNTSYGIEIKGISLDQMIATWDRLRYQEYIVSGDLYLNPDGTSVVTIRYETSGAAKSFKKPLTKVTPESIQDAISDLSLQLVGDINPEAKARYLIGISIACNTDSECDNAWSEAVKFCSNWVTIDPQNYLPLYYLGYSLSNEGFSEDGLTMMKRAYAINNNSDIVLNGMGQILLKYGKIDEIKEAEIDFKSALPKNRTKPNPNPIMNLGIIEFRRGNYQRAEEQYHAALSIDPHDVGALLNLGIVENYVGKYSDAVDHFEQVRILQPGNAYGLYGLAISLTALKKSKDAIREFEFAARLDPKSPGPLIAKSMVLMRTNQTHEAMEVLNDLRKRSKSSDPDVDIQFGIAYACAGDLPAAAAEFDKILKRHYDDFTDARLHILKAQILIRQGNETSSTDEASQAEKLYPGAKYVFWDDYEYWSKMSGSATLVPIRK
jgi:tetratricopeptide (TPR) repeat protein